MEEVKDGSQLIQRGKKIMVSSVKTLGIRIVALTCVVVWLYTHPLPFMAGWRC